MEVSENKMGLAAEFYKVGVLSCYTFSQQIVAAGRLKYR